VDEPSKGVSDRNGAETNVDGFREGVEGGGSEAADDGFELAEGGFNGKEVRGVGGQAQDSHAERVKEGLDEGGGVEGDVVEENDVAGTQGGSEALGDIGLEASAVDGAFDEARGGGAIGPQAGEQ
jgi:hypothetical protein